MNLTKPRERRRFDRTTSIVGNEGEVDEYRCSLKEWFRANREGGFTSQEFRDIRETIAQGLPYHGCGFVGITWTIRPL